MHGKVLPYTDPGATALPLDKTNYWFSAMVLVRLQGLLWVKFKTAVQIGLNLPACYSLSSTYLYIYI